jgi:hypothetical protein
MLPLMAAEEKVSRVPGATVPVLVTESDGFAKEPKVSAQTFPESLVMAYREHQDHSSR